jgi:hypothetical protein
VSGTLELPFSNFRDSISFGISARVQRGETEKPQKMWIKRSRVK